MVALGDKALGKSDDILGCNSFSSLYCAMYDVRTVSMLYRHCCQPSRVALEAFPIVLDQRLIGLGQFFRLAFLRNRVKYLVDLHYGLVSLLGLEQQRNDNGCIGFGKTRNPHSGTDGVDSTHLFANLI